MIDLIITTRASQYDKRSRNVAKEATARIKINKLLEAVGWRFFPDGHHPANIRLEPTVALKQTDLEQIGDNFEKTKKEMIDFLLLDSRGFPLIVLEAKAEDNNPLTGKEQARKYARSQNCRFVILSNGNLHYFWDLERGTPHLITTFPTPESVTGYQKQVMPDSQRLVNEPVNADYIAVTQRPAYRNEAGWKNEAERPLYIQTNKLRFLRPYQLKAIHHIKSRRPSKKARIAFSLKWRLARQDINRRRRYQTISPLRQRPTTPGAFSFWWTGWNWKIRLKKRSPAYCRPTSRPSFTRKTGTIGSGPKLS
jgi:type I site-specific restriction endonuclease